MTTVAGPNIHGSDTSQVPAAVPVALFAMLGTWVVSHYAFRHR